MQKGVLTAIVVLTILCSGIMSSAQNSSKLQLDDDTVSIRSVIPQSPETKLHQPGESHESPETLIWAPNNMTEFSAIQFSIILDENFPIETLEQIRITGYWISINEELFQQFSFTITDFLSLENNQENIITENYTYPNTIWGGNYSLTTEIYLSTGEEITSERSDVKFSSHSYYLGHATPNEIVYLCTCEKKSVAITIKNTGEDETEFYYSLDLNEDFQSARVEWDEISQERSSGYLLAGESIRLTLEVLMYQSTSSKYDILEIPIVTEISYQNDNDEQVFLENKEVLIAHEILNEDMHPNAAISFDEFDFKLEFNDGVPARVPFGKNSDFFTLGNENVLLNLSITNPGYFDRVVTFIPTNTDFTYSIITNEDNYSFQEFEAQQPIIHSLETNDYIVLIENTGQIQNETIGLNIAFNNSLTSFVSFDIKPQPTVTSTIFSQITVLDEQYELPLDLPIAFDINLIEFEEFLYFNNEWELICSTNSGVDVSIITLNANCGGNPAYLIPEEQSDINTINSRILIDDNYAQEYVEIMFNLVPRNSHSNLNTIHNLSFNLTVSHDDEENEQNNNTQDDQEDEHNNSKGDDESSDNENDTDQDGVLDLIDNCPDTEPNTQVNALGCKIIEENNDGILEQDDDLEQESESLESKSDDSFNWTFAAGTLILLTVIGGLVIIKARNKPKSSGLTPSKTIEPIMPLPALPLPSLEPVVIQQWTDGNGYSWRLMSDQSIMWWNGTDWIPYGKK
tara:strand:- start:1158 stop:3383 length:2226 start_codon:yes stop_codon:yes gene_type:complete